MQYLAAWLTMFQALELIGEREVQQNDIIMLHGDKEVDSMATFDTMDLNEYLVDVTDGMEREWEMEEHGVVLTPLWTGSTTLAKDISALRD